MLWVKYIILNYLPVPWELTEGQYQDPVPNWRTEWVLVEDGGIHFWRIEYDVTTKQCRQFRVNMAI